VALSALSQGELYLRTTLPFLSEAVTRAEAAFIDRHLPVGPRLDLGCGHGRHLRYMPAPAVGVDRDPTALALAEGLSTVAADFRALPFADASFCGIYAWYNAATCCERVETVAALAEARRCLRPGGSILIQATHRCAVEDRPTAHFERRLPSGEWLMERTRWDPARGCDRIERTLTSAKGEFAVLSFFVKYYSLADWTAILGEAELDVTWTCGGIDDQPLVRRSLDLIVGAKRRD
jgi:SAM-dependent methyltransferase